MREEEIALPDGVPARRRNMHRIYQIKITYRPKMTHQLVNACKFFAKIQFLYSIFMVSGL